MRILTAVNYRDLLEVECGWGVGGGGLGLMENWICPKCALCKPLANMRLMLLCNHCQSSNCLICMNMSSIVFIFATGLQNTKCEQIRFFIQWLLSSHLMFIPSAEMFKPWICHQVSFLLRSTHMKKSLCMDSISSLLTMGRPWQRWIHTSLLLLKRLLELWAGLDF